MLAKKILPVTPAAVVIVTALKKENPAKTAAGTPPKPNFTVLRMNIPPISLISCHIIHPRSASTY